VSFAVVAWGLAVVAAPPAVAADPPDFTSLTPARVLDTRVGIGGVQGKVGQGAAVDVLVTGTGGVPASGVAAVVLNVAVTEPTAPSFLTVFPAGQPRPNSANLNFVAGQDLSNLVVAKVGAGGKVSVYNNAGSTHVVFDVAGWFASTATSFNSLPPARILDTRNGTGGLAGKVGPAGTVDIQVTGTGGVPASGVGAVVLNVAVTEATAPSYLTVFPAGQPRPFASNLNFVAGQTVSNLVVAKVGAGGKVSVYDNAGATHVIFDVAGWFSSTTTSFTSLTPARILDTRTSTGGLPGKVGPGATIDAPVTGAGGVPATGVAAVVLNVTVTEPTAPSFLTVFPTGQARPTASNLNFVAGQDLPNMVVAKVGAGGKVSVYNNAGSTHVVFDVVGWFATAPVGPPQGVVQISSDPFTNSSSQHQTQVEPDTFASGNTVVSAFQTGRFTDGGSSGLGWATSTDAGATWTNGTLPGLTVSSSPAGAYDRASDPSVAFDPRHNVWLVSALAMAGSRGAAVTVSRSSDGLSWSSPVVVSSTATGAYDKEWVVCDDHASSPHYGNCYMAFDDNALGDVLLNSTSTDGGATWGPALQTADSAHGFGTQPVVQPTGTVVVATLDGAASSVNAYRSVDGGQSWSAVRPVTPVSFHDVAGGLRAEALPAAGVDGAGRVYVVWSDCRFASSCQANDIVMATSSDGVDWSGVARIPIEATAGIVDHFVPGLAVDPSTSGGTARLALAYYFYATPSCSFSTCQLQVGSVTSANGGATWGPPTQLSPSPMSLSWLPTTTQGYMVGDYISASFVGGKAIAAFALASAPDAAFHEAMYAAVLP
jgi:hypothetical protein